MFAGAPALIDAPPPPPQKPYGIFSVALGPMPLPRPEIENFGLVYVPDQCFGNGYLYSNDCPTPSGSVAFLGIDTTVTGSPFTVGVSYTCGSIGWSFAEVETRLRTRMSLREQQLVEKRIWQGSTGPSAIGQIPGLFKAGNGLVTVTDLGPSACITEAVEVLEQALADNNIQGGVIHARPGMAAHFANGHILEDGPGRTKVTPYGTPISFGQGYDGTGPTGQAVTTDVEWLFASGRVLIWRTDDLVIPPIGQTMNRATNQITAFAEKNYVVAIECGVWATQVLRNCTTAP